MPKAEKPVKPGKAEKPVKPDASAEDTSMEDTSLEDENTETTGQETGPAPADINHASANQPAGVDLTAPELPQAINGVVVPRTKITGTYHVHERTRPIGKSTSRVVSKPTTHVRYSHPGLRALVVREFDHPKQALEFVQNPNNTAFHPEFVDPDSVHAEEMQQHVTRIVHAKQAPKKKGRIDAPVGSPDYMPEPDEPQNAAGIL